MDERKRRICNGKGKSSCIRRKSEKKSVTPYWVDNVRGVRDQMWDDRQMTKIIKKCLHIKSHQLFLDGPDTCGTWQQHQQI